MKNTNFIKDINSAKTVSELNDLKNHFLSECSKREDKILVSNILNQIDNFCSAKVIFESLAVPLMSKKEGKKLIKEYSNIIKENKSLKTIYAYHEGLKENKTSDNKKSYITEALSLESPFNKNEYITGIGKIVNIISESFKLLGDKFILENISCDENTKSIGNSLYFLSTNKKSIKNLNEYISHIDNVSDIIIEDKTDTINSDLTLDEIVSKINENNSSKNMNDIFNAIDKEKTFIEAKNICLNIISKQKKENSDNEVLVKLNEIEEKLSKKEYVYDTFTKDMLYMTELQEVLK